MPAVTVGGDPFVALLLSSSLEEALDFIFASQPIIAAGNIDTGVGANVLANWGLHLIDVNLSMGNLLDIIGQETRTFLKK